MLKWILKQLYFQYKNFIFSKNNQLKKNVTIAYAVKLNNCILNDFSRIAERASASDSTIGAYSTIGRYAKITHTEIGKFCAISWDTTINAISHPYTHLTINAFPYVPYVGGFVKKRKQSYQAVIIKNDVWIGANSVIMPGLTIGNGAIIGAGAVVTKDVPDYAIVAGVPAKIIKYRFSEDIIDRLLELKWWDLAPKVIEEHVELWGGEFNCNSLRKLEEICK